MFFYNSLALDAKTLATLLNQQMGEFPQQSLSSFAERSSCLSV